MELWKVDSNLIASGNLYFLLAAGSWSALSIFSQRSKNNMSPFVFSFYIYGFSSFFNFFLAVHHGIFDVFSFEPFFWINLLYISIGATTFATTAYFIAASKIGASKASSFTFLVPASALFFSWLILHEIPTFITVFGGLLALLAVYIINYKHIKKI